MKITITIPDWAQERNIYIMAGIELLAYKLYGEDVIHIKTARCCACGECCLDLPFGGHLPTSRDGHCAYLEDSIGGVRNCLLGLFRPLACSAGRQRIGVHPSCTVEYRVESL